MILAQVRSVRFLIDKDKHTVRYADTGLHFEKAFNEGY